MPLKLYRRGKVWHYRGTVAGRRIRGSCQTTDQDRAARTAAEIEGREWKCSVDGPESVLTFAQASLLYRKAGKEVRFLERIEDHWKDTLVKDIKASAIKQMALELYPSATNATRNRQAIIPCQAVINHAAEAELCSYIRVKRFKTDKKIKAPFTLEWVDAFWKHRDNDYIGALALFMYASGARISEALAVRWEHVELERSVALIPKSKIREQREVHLPPRMVAVLANLTKVPNRSIFWYKTRMSCMRSWENTIKAAGIKRMTPHSARHGFATTTLRKGIDPKTGAYLGGWKSIRHYMETYAHAIQDLTLNEVIFDTPVTQPERRNQRNQRKTGTS